jgi:hypothetical protein
MCSSSEVWAGSKGKMIHFETIPGVEGEGDEREWWKGKFKYAIFDIL